MRIRQFLADERGEARTGTMVVFTVILLGVLVLLVRGCREEALRTMPNGSSG